MGKNNRLPRHKTSEMTSTPAWRTGFPSTRSALKFVVFSCWRKAEAGRPSFPDIHAGGEKVLNFKELIAPPTPSCSGLQEKDQLFYKGKLCSVLMCYCKN